MKNRLEEGVFTNWKIPDYTNGSDECSGARNSRLQEFYRGKSGSGKRKTWSGGGRELKKKTQPNYRVTVYSLMSSYSSCGG